MYFGFCCAFFWHTLPNQDWTMKCEQSSVNYQVWLFLVRLALIRVIIRVIILRCRYACAFYQVAANPLADAIVFFEMAQWTTLNTMISLSMVNEPDPFRFFWYFWCSGAIREKWRSLRWVYERAWCQRMLTGCVNVNVSMSKIYAEFTYTIDLVVISTRWC